MPTNKKITYLLGAGASYNALPLVKEIYTELFDMMRYITAYNQRIYTLGNENEFSKTYEIVHSLKDHYSIDTLARKYKLKNDLESYNRVKNIIASLIIFKALKLNYDALPMPDINSAYTINNRTFTKLDNRYDSFLAALLTENELYLPKNINVISWNYDFQFELAMSFYTGNNLLSTAYNTNIYNEGLSSPINKNYGSIIKINGTAIMYIGEAEKIDYTNYDDKIHNLLFQALKNEISPEVCNNIKFAWESESQIQSRNLAQEIIGESDFIVVIGYSFPIFNREIDISLFRKFNPDFSRIIIQDIPSRINAIRGQLEAIQPGLSNDSITMTQTDLDQFFIPNEYWNFYEPPSPLAIFG